MSKKNSLIRLATHFGVVSTYTDLAGQKKPTSRETNLALLRANGLNLSSEKDIQVALIEVESQNRIRTLPRELVITPGERVALPVNNGFDWQIEFDENLQSELTGKTGDELVLPELPLGLHVLTVGKGENKQTTRLICAPNAAPSLEDAAGHKRIWGINAALYGLTSKENPGIGNFGMLTQAADAFAKHGADFIGINPVHAIGWNSPEIISPYSPTHRGFLNSRHISVGDVSPRSDQTSRLIADWQKATDNADASDLADYAAHNQHSRKILSALFDDFLNLATPKLVSQFGAFCKTGGGALRRFAEFEHLSELYGSNPSRWPPTSSNSDAAPISATCERDKHLLFHAWLQWIAHLQLEQVHEKCRAAGMKLGLYLDLAVGARRDGAEAWGENQSIAEGVSIGAPPDHLSPEGQNWNLAAYAPSRLAADNYRSFRNVLRQTMRYCGVIRIDHILGLNRSYWIPDDGSPGGYVKQNFEAMLALVRLEAHRSKTLVVGEDLGLVPIGFRKTMNRQNIYSYGVLQYEKNKRGRFKPVSKLRKKSLVCFGTHDTPTLAGYRQGSDIDWWQKLGWIDPSKAHEMHKQRQLDLMQLLALAGKKPADASLDFELLQAAIYDVLAGSDTAMISVQLDDVFALAEAQNLPGTIDEHPNWQRLYPCPVDDFERDERLAALAKIMRMNERGLTAPLEKVT